VIEVREVSKLFTIPHQRPRTVFDRLFGRSRYTHEAYPALRDVSLHVARGEFVGILGGNGSGKSTLLRIVAGIYPPSRGEVTVHGALAPILELGVGFQGPLTVSANVLLYGVLMGIPRQTLRTDLPAILDWAGLQRFADARLDTLSTGMRMRLAFTVALRADAPILLVDEALAVGDAGFRDRCFAALEELRAQGRTALVVSHDEGTLARLCDRVVVLHEGMVRGEGAPEAMFALYRTL
jgi:lipopolysaccharide transport system ATP-binding protein